MAELSPNASREEIEDELLFQEVLINSLDPGADDFYSALAGLEEKKQGLTRRMELLDMGGPPVGLDGTSDPVDPPGRSDHGASSPLPGNMDSTPSHGQANSAKRPRPYSSSLAQNEYPSKRHTPEHSSGSTPTSSSSFEFVDHPNLSTAERARDRQLQGEAAMRRRLQEQQADAEFARRLSQTPAQATRPIAGPSSSQRPGIQTTLGHNGSFTSRPSPFNHPLSTGAAPPSSQSQPAYPPPPSANATPPGMSRVKQEPRPAFQQQQQQPRSGHERAPVVDLTGDDSDDGPSEIAPNRFTPSKRSASRPSQSTKSFLPQIQQQDQRQRQEQLQLQQRVQQRIQQARQEQEQRQQRHPSALYSQLPAQQVITNMPGQFPGLVMNVNGKQVYGPPNPSGYRPPPTQPQPPTTAGYPHPPYSFGAGPTPYNGAYAPGSSNGVNGTPRGPTGRLEELRGLLPGSRSLPYTMDDDDDDDPYFGRSRLGGPSAYLGQEELYQRRFDQLQEHDPEKTKEQINELLNNIRPDEDVPEDLLVPTPEALTIQLHKYQEMGLTWLKAQEEGTNKGAILGDDMGLGKTIQMLALMVTRKSDDPRCKTTLIVAPVALLRQWKQEIQQKIKTGRHALTVFIHHGPSKKKSFRDLQHYDVVLTTYGSLASEVKKMELYHKRKKNDPDARPNKAELCALIDPDALWYRVILDEAQCIKNKSTQTAKGAFLINAKYRFCMTGTPMMNNVGELFSLIHFLQIKPYCQWEKFRFDFITPLKSNLDEHREKSMRMLQALCRAVMLRRTKTSKYKGRPILVLPERTTNVEHAVFSEDETAFYQGLEAKTAVQFNKYVKAGTVGRSYTAILVLLLRLRQAACHPHLIKDFSVSEAAGVAVEDMVKLAEQLEPQVIARIKESGGNFECPICMDGCTNPAIFLPCGHDTCRDCFVTLSDPANQLAQGNENGTTVRCPECRGNIDTKRITDFESFRRVHMRDTLSKEELEALDGNNSDADMDDDDSNTDSEDDDDDGDGTLGGFVVPDHEVDEPEDSATESEAEEEAAEADVKAEKVKSERVKAEDDDEDEGAVVGPSRRKGKEAVISDAKGKKEKKPEKGKGKAKKKELNLADLKKLATRSASAKKKYLKRLRRNFISSAKIDRMMDLLTEVIETADTGEKILIFSQWTSLLDLAEVPIEGKKWGYRRYDGSMNAKMRGDAVDDFKDARKDVRVMLVSLKAGNAGLNLNVASRVIILDPFWNPYIEEQAIDRAHRIGQARPVKVHRVLVEATVEDRIIELQDKKRAVIEEALDEKKHRDISRLGVQELAYLFGVTRNANERIEYQERRR